MVNSISLSVEVPETLTTKQLANSLGVSVDTIQSVVKKLAENNRQVFETLKRNSQGGYLFTEAQATAIKIELQNHSKVAKNGFDTLSVSNDLEGELLVQRAMAYQELKIKELQQRAEKAEQKVIEQKPKVDWYDNVADSSNLTEIGTVGKMTNIGSQKIFKALRADKIIYQKTDSDGITYDVPFYDYEKYFKTVPEPFIKGDKKCVRNKLLFTQAGVIWATNKYKAKEAFTIKEVSEILNLEIDEILQFLNLKHYIKLEEDDFSATDLGLYYGYMCIKDGFVCVTKKCFDKIEKAFCHNELPPEEQERVEKLCKEAERAMRPSVIGLAE